MQYGFIDTFHPDLDTMVDPDFDSTEMDADLAADLAEIAWQSALRGVMDSGREYSL